MNLARLARAAAVAIAVLGVIDPAIAVDRRTSPVVVVLDTARPGFGDDLAGRVAAALDDDVRVVGEVAAGAAAVVVAGDRLPAHASAFTGPVFVVRPGESRPAVAIARVDAPATATVDARVPVRVRIETRGAAGRIVDVRLRQGGVVLDHVSRDVTNVAGPVDVALWFVAAREGLAPVRIDVETAGASTYADLAIDVRRDRLRVLFFDGRPSWSSTFVRRALERDPRFDISFRTRTSSGIDTGTTGAPAGLTTLEAVTAFHAIVVSAPEALTARDRAGLDAFARRRGGAVVLLLDGDPGSTVAPLTGVSGWQLVSLPEPVAIEVPTAVAGSLRAAELIAAPEPPPRARVIATAADGRPVLFEVPAGAGRVLVSGLADAWRYRRAEDDAAFAELWTQLIGAAAAAAPPPIAIALDPTAAAPGEQVQVRVAVRDVLLSTALPPQLTVGAVLAGTHGETPVRLWPDGAPGVFRGTFRAPLTPAAARLHVRADDAIASATVAVVEGARRPMPDQADLLGWWAATRGGRVFAASDLDALREAIAAAAPAERTPGRRHFMRSPWWIVPFALLLGVEWRARRRAGQR